MTTGSVSHRQARVGVVFRLPGRSDIEIEFVVDTGFEGALTLPELAITALGLQFYEERIANLADDSSIIVGVYRASILWDGIEHSVAVLATGKRPLLGTALLDGFDLNVQFAEGGIVTIERL